MRINKCDIGFVGLRKRRPLHRATKDQDAALRPVGSRAIVPQSLNKDEGRKLNVFSPEARLVVSCCLRSGVVNR